MQMWRTPLGRLAGAALALMVSATVWAGGASAQEAPLRIELNKLESFEAGCRSFFLFRNRSDLTLSEFEMSLAILDKAGVIDRLLTIDAAPLPADRTTLKLFEIPEIACDDIGEVILHDIASCATASGEAQDCFALIELSSLAPAPLVK
jgi:hypothetical protein